MKVENWVYGTAAMLDKRKVEMSAVSTVVPMDDLTAELMVASTECVTADSTAD